MKLFDLNEYANKVSIRKVKYDIQDHDDEKWIFKTNESKWSFWINYCFEITESENFIYPIFEKKENLSPLRIEMNYEFSKKERYDGHYYFLICWLFQKIITEKFIINNDSTLICFFMGSNVIEISKDVNHMKHVFHFPYVRISKKDILIFEEQINKEITDEVLNILKIPFTKDKFHLFLNINTNTSIIYNSTLHDKTNKSMNDLDELKQINNKILPNFNIIIGNLYNIDKVLSNNLLTLKNTHTITESTVVSSHCSWIESISDNDKEKLDSMEEYDLLPIFLSVNYGDESIIPKLNLEEDEEFESEFEDFNTNDNFEILKSLLSFFNTKRFSFKEDWINIGKACHHSSDDKEIALELWISITNDYIHNKEKNNKSFLDNVKDIRKESRNLFQTFYKNNITLKTVAWYNKEDDPQRYKLWHKKLCINYINDAVESDINAHSIFAKAFFKIYWLDYIFSPLTNKWYYFNGYRWTIAEREIEILLTITEKFYLKFEKIKTVAEHEIEYNTSDKDKNRLFELKKLKNNCRIIINNLRNVTYKRRLLTAMCEYFKLDDFEKIINKNYELFGTSNGVLDMSNKSIHFRSGKPEDYITFSNHVPYNNNINENDEIILKIMDWVSKIFIEKECIEYFLKVNASFLFGRNLEKAIYIHTGPDGNNSKTTWLNLLRCTFGDYHKIVDGSIFTERNSNTANANPAIARLECARIAQVNESDETKKMNSATAKKHSGGDLITTRGLFQDTKEMETTYKFNIACNHAQSTDKDKGMLIRLKLLFWISVFVDNAPETIEEQFKQRKFKKDPHFGDNDKIKIMAPYLLFILVIYFRKYLNEGLVVPKVFQEMTSKYWDENDVFTLYMNDRVDILPRIDGIYDQKYSLSMTQISDDFVTWHGKNYPRYELPKKPYIKIMFIESWGPFTTGNGWYGIKFKASDRSIFASQESFMNEE